ncbi:CD40 ligand [Boleophthalmus pectinirostris]|uniref:tumor necrosis factor ligand superfamily member 15-like n=1 Tax=Boleophthalmus pectinirostris TaxID=150288 RepID=UPI000A1C57D5|nr:tumor necrosis factor ligand superfamily member 15-like [Boleophthalmus pectinirostris]XP_055015359.1 CD40 ligand [Boleophthalmus pectinirostris]
MINTYHSSVAPPPVPPRLHNSRKGPQPVLIPTTMLPQGHSRTVMCFMVTVVLFNLLLSILGFIYLYTNGIPQRKQDMPVSSAEAKFSMQEQHSPHVEKRESHRVFARMKFQRPTTPHRPQRGHLKWDLKHSQYSQPYINYYNSSWLTIEKPGDYFVYSRVTFSKSHSSIPLTNRVLWRKTTTDKPKSIMDAFCLTISTLCTATAEDVIKLERGNQLSIWTEDISLVRYDETATAFGLYNL